MSYPFNTDWGLKAHNAAEAHLMACLTAMYSDEEPEPEWPDTAGPFCGCETCFVREVLHAAWPILLEAARAEVAETALRAIVPKDGYQPGDF